VEFQPVTQTELATVDGGMIRLREYPDIPPQEGTGGGALRVNFSYWSDEYFFLPF
jgi:hypothetical protein